jgi:predicted dehydrogenase
VERVIKVLIIGLGSIGKRHLVHLKNIKNVELAALRTSKGQLNFDVEINSFYDLKEALNYMPDGVLISNPTALHVDSALPFLQKGIKILFEKPIDSNIENALKLEPYKALLRVAYCMRFNPVSEKLVEIFKKEIPFKVGFKRSFYLPKWHPYADYTKEYTALKSLGGGVIRTLSHEIDLMIHWFGEPAKVTGVVDKVSHLEIDTDDYAFFTCKLKNNTRVNFELDFFSPTNINIGEAYTENGVYRWGFDYINFESYQGESISILSDNEALHNMYQKQMCDFISFIETNNSDNCTFEDAIRVLNIISNVEN